MSVLNNVTTNTNDTKVPVDVASPLSSSEEAKKGTTKKVQNIVNGLDETVIPVTVNTQPIQNKQVELVDSKSSETEVEKAEKNASTSSEQSKTASTQVEAESQTGESHGSATAAHPYANIIPWIKGIGAGILIPVVCNPLDRLQAQLLANTYQGTRPFFSKDLYRGLSIKIVNNSVGYTSMFALAPIIRSTIDWIAPDAADTFKKIFSYTAASTIDPIVTGPLSTISLRMQAYDKSFKTVIKELPLFSRPDDLLKELYKGTFASGVRNVAFGGIYGSLYDILRERMCGNVDSGIPMRTILANVGISTAAGGVASMYSYPFDVISKKMKVNNSNTSVTGTIKTIFENEGIFGFYKGFNVALPRMFLAFGAAGMVFGAVDAWAEKTKEK